jgi:cell division protease FtsH
LFVPLFINAAEETSRDMWETIFINWFPMLLLIGVWIYFMKTMKKGKKKCQESF